MGRAETRSLVSPDTEPAPRSVIDVVISSRNRRSSCVTPSSPPAATGKNAVIELPSSKRLVIGGEGFFLVSSAGEVVVYPLGKHCSSCHLELVHVYDRLADGVFS